MVKLINSMSLKSIKIVEKMHKTENIEKREVNLKKNVKLFYLLSFLYELFRSSFYGIQALFILNTLNLKIYHIGIIKIFNPITIALFEIPTGIIADKFGRRLNFILSGIVSSIAFFIYGAALGVYQAILGEILYSVSLSLQTGSLDALIVSQAKEREDVDIAKILSISFACRTAGTLTGGTLGILLSTKNMRLPWILSSFGFVLLTILSLYVDGTMKKKYTLNLFKGFKDYLSNLRLVYLTLLSIGVAIINIPFFNYWQIFVEKELHLHRGSKGFILMFILYNLLMLIGGLSLKFLNSKFGSKNTLYLSTYLIAIPTIFMVTTTSFYLAILTFMVSEFARGTFFPSYSYVFNEHIPDKSRSIYLSKQSFFRRLFDIFTYLSLGLLARIDSDVKLNMYLFSVLGVIIISLAIILSTKLDRKENFNHG